MEFLKEFLTDETYNAMAKELEGKEVKLANLSGGEYVSKGKFESQSKEYSEAKQLIEKLKGENANNEKMQSQIGQYEAEIEKLKAEAEKAKIESEFKVKLLEAKAKPTDIDYLLFKTKQNNPELKLDEQGHIKGIDDIVSGLKSSYSSNFESKETKKIEVNTLPRGEENKLSKEEFSKMKYNERNALYNENPELYRELSQN